MLQSNSTQGHLRVSFLCLLKKHDLHTQARGEITMRDSQKNELLAKYGLGTIETKVVDVNGGEREGLRSSSFVYLAKGESKGYAWMGEANQQLMVTRSMMKDMKMAFRNTSEKNKNFMPDILNVLHFGMNNGMFTKEAWDAFRLSPSDFDHQQIRNAIHDGIMPDVSTPRKLIFAYGYASSLSARGIRECVQSVKDLLSEAGFLYTFEGTSDNWVVEEGIKAGVVGKELQNKIAILKDRKKRIDALYKGLADRFKLGSSPLGHAFAFAAAWEAIFTSQTYIASREDADSLNRELAKFIETYGYSPVETEDEMDSFIAELPKYQYTQLGTVCNLFPTGALSFFKLVADNKVMQYKKPSSHVFAYLHHPALTEERRAQAKSWEGQTITFYNGHVYTGSSSLDGFQIKTENYTKTGMHTKSPRRRMEVEGYTQEEISLVESHKYTEAAHVWTGGFQQARVLFVDTKTQAGKDIKSGVKVWLENLTSFPNVTIEQYEAVRQQRMSQAASN